MFQIERVPAKFTAVTPLSLKSGKKKRVPAQKITLEFLLPNGMLRDIDDGLLEAFFKARTAPVVDKKSKNLQADLSGAALPDLRFPWWKEWISVPLELVGYQGVLHTGNSEKSHINLDVEKGDNARVLPHGDGQFKLSIQILVKPAHREKGLIEDLLQTDNTAVSLLAPELPLTQDTLFKPKAPAVENGEIVDKDPLGVNGNEDPDPFAGSDLARDAKGGAK